MRVTRGMLDEGLRKCYGRQKLLGMALGVLFGHERLARSALKLEAKIGRGKYIDGLDCAERYIPSSHGGRDIRIRIYRPENIIEPLPGLVYFHGGGYGGNNPEEYHAIIRRYIETSPCVIVAPDYRKSFEAPYPAAFDDCVDTLLWLQDNATELGARSDKFIVAGHSAGGGMTAAVSAWARDTGNVKIAFQMPIYPMLDDRPTESNTNNNAPVWNSTANRNAWAAYLRGLSDIPGYAAPARETDFKNLPPTITYVGDIEPFRDETIAYVAALRRAGVPVAFELFPGAYHSFELAVPTAEISQRAWAFELDHFQEFITRYFY